MTPLNSSPHQAIIDTLETQGWSVSADFLSLAAARQLSQESQETWNLGAFKRAGVGGGKDSNIREDIRSDLVMWLRTGETTGAQQTYLDVLEDLRLALNQHFFFGLFDFEGHFAIYPEGGFYKPHLDRPHHTSSRIVTVILYLNENWNPGDGGELKLWTTPNMKEGPFQIIEPRLGTLVCFLAENYWHEVLPSLKTRMSITGWFRVRD